jgi:uncharacterized protein (TIGR02466 family)
MSTARVERLFATPVLAGMWPGAREHNGGLRAAILAERARDRGVAKSNLHGWQSNTEMTRWGGAPAAALEAELIARCTEITSGLRNGAQWVAEMWGNVSPPGASNQTHAHPGSLWSAVYYVDDGYAGSADKALGGELSFLDPRFPMVRMAAPDLRWRKPDGKLDNQEVWMRPRAGLIVIFPSWLQHSVRPYAGNATRISIATNLWVREAA